MAKWGSYFVPVPYRLLFIVANDPCPKLESGGLDWNSITEIEIVGIVDTH